MMGGIDPILRNGMHMPFTKGRRPISMMMVMVTGLCLVYVHLLNVVEDATFSFKSFPIKVFPVSALSHRGQQTALNGVQMELKLSDDDEKEEPMPSPLYSEGDCTYPGDTPFEKVISRPQIESFLAKAPAPVTYRGLLQSTEVAAAIHKDISCAVQAHKGFKEFCNTSSKDSDEENAFVNLVECLAFLSHTFVHTNFWTEFEDTDTNRECHASDKYPCGSAAASYHGRGALKTRKEEDGSVIDLDASFLENLPSWISYLSSENEKGVSSSSSLSSKLIFIAFTAPWCHHCRALYTPFVHASQVYRHRIKQIRDARESVISSLRLQHERDIKHLEERADLLEKNLMNYQVKKDPNTKDDGERSRQEGEKRTEEEIENEREISSLEQTYIQGKQDVLTMKRKFREEEERLMKSHTGHLYANILFVRFDCFQDERSRAICQKNFSIDRYPTLLLLSIDTFSFLLQNNVKDRSSLISMLSSQEKKDTEPYKSTSSRETPFFLEKFSPHRPRTSESIVDFLLKATVHERSSSMSSYDFTSGKRIEEEGEDKKTKKNDVLSWIENYFRNTPVREILGTNELDVLLYSPPIVTSSVSFVMCIDLPQIIESHRRKLSTSSSSSLPPSSSSSSSSLSTSSENRQEKSEEDSHAAQSSMSIDIEQVRESIEIFIDAAVKNRYEHLFFYSYDPSVCLSQISSVYRDIEEELISHINDVETPASSSSLLKEISMEMRRCALEPDRTTHESPFFSPLLITSFQPVGSHEGGEEEEEERRRQGERARERFYQRQTNRLKAFKSIVEQIARDHFKTHLLHSSLQQHRRRNRLCSYFFEELSSVLSPTFYLTPLSSSPLSSSSSSLFSSSLIAFLDYYRVPVFPWVNQESFTKLRSSTSPRFLILIAIDTSILTWLGKQNFVSLSSVLVRSLERLKRGKWLKELKQRKIDGRVGENLSTQRHSTARLHVSEKGEEEERKIDKNRRRELPREMIEEDDLVLRNSLFAYNEGDEKKGRTTDKEEEEREEDLSWMPTDENELSALLYFEKVWKIMKVTRFVNSQQYRKHLSSSLQNARRKAISSEDMNEKDSPERNKKEMCQASIGGDVERHAGEMREEKLFKGERREAAECVNEKTQEDDDETIEEEDERGMDFVIGIVDGLLFSNSLRDSYGVYTPEDLPAVIGLDPFPPSSNRERRGERSYDQGKEDDFSFILSENDRGDEQKDSSSSYPSPSLSPPKFYRDRRRLTIDNLFEGLDLLRKREIRGQIEGEDEEEEEHSQGFFRLVARMKRHFKKWLRQTYREANESWPNFIRILFGFFSFFLLLLTSAILFLHSLCSSSSSQEDQRDEEEDEETEESSELDDEESSSRSGGSSGEEEGEVWKKKKQLTVEDVKRRAERMLRKRR
ncbi:chitinase-like protein clp1 [Cystoisospora suis]|uniref:Chitinase-like protein clp1 n=1 Tax=Cystoisospora suis TaxID=483139 RepID=A0A2C6L8W4_9APIC|nr:chitinase-like protein clp1 [Cystoisospora suis]